MAVAAERVAVSGTATPLNAASTTVLRLTINTQADDVDLGDSGVVSGSGYLLAAADAPLTVEIDAGAVLHAVAATTATVHVLRT